MLMVEKHGDLALDYLCNRYLYDIVLYIRHFFYSIQTSPMYCHLWHSIQIHCIKYQELDSVDVEKNTIKKSEK